VRAGGACGASVRRSARARPQASWPWTTRRRSGGSGRPPGSMGAPRRPVAGVGGHATACAMGGLLGSWPTVPRHGRSRAYPTHRGRPWRRCRPLWHGPASLSTLRSTRHSADRWGLGWSRLANYNAPIQTSCVLSYHWPDGISESRCRCRQVTISAHGTERERMSHPVLPPRL